MVFWRRISGLVLSGLLMPAGMALAVNAEGVEFFESHVRPLLVAKCYECHSADAKKLKGDLRLDTRAGVLRGGESGTAALVAGDLKHSLLIEAVRYTNPDLQMPPKERLTKEQVATLETWVAMGAPDPRGADVAKAALKGAEFWSFRRPKDVAPPAVKDGAWVRTAVDSFILAKLEAKGLRPAKEADRRTLIRRATFDLLGLPPTAGEVEAFENDKDADAWEKVIDRLLASPRYGERWGRYWLDLARYSDTKGYVYDRDERRFVHAYNYRDWVIGAMNADMPYDRFLMLQLAADQMGEKDGAKQPEDLAAMGFLTVGRRFLGVVHDIIDDRIDVTMRTTQGLSVACARCHDHKFDPIPTTDYYALYGVFAGSTEEQVCLDPAPKETEAYAAWAKGLKARTDKLNTTFAAKKEQLLTRVRARTVDYLAAVPGAGKLPDDLFYSFVAPEDLNPIIIRQWSQYLFERGKQFDAVWAPWKALSKLSPADFAVEGPKVIAGLMEDAVHPLNVRVAAAFASARPASMGDVAKIYGKVLAEGGEDAALRAVLYGADTPARVPAGSVADTEWFFDENTRVELAKLQAEIDRWNINTAGAPPHAVVLKDRAEQRTPRVFKRGNPATKGEEVQRHFLTAIAGANAPAFQKGSGRLEMARAIASRENPLTARVMVNRIWMHHFGAGLVTTPSDFGTRSDLPSHPELLDWLAVKFMEQGWSIKAMHRLMMRSATYRESSGGSENNSADPENQLLSRANRTRLDFEAMRDGMLMASGEMDLLAGGKPAEIGGNRRTVYALVDRQFLPDVFRVFDFANPDLHIPIRGSTTVPQQALFFMNGAFAEARAKALANRRGVVGASGDVERIQKMYEVVYQRKATEKQVAAGLAFLKSAGAVPAPAEAPVANPWRYGFGEYDELGDRLKSFTPLPYCNGEAWQGGAAWPDAKLGWVQITATGGHAGNDLAHAAVRRWVAPADMVVSIEGTARHEYTAGDGITVRLLSSRQKTLLHQALHNSSAEMKVERLEVKAGDTMDFVVDFAHGLNSDMFTWTPVIKAIEGSGTWNAAADFAAGVRKNVTPSLDPWTRYAHVLLMSNEFLFVD